MSASAPTTPLSPTTLPPVIGDGGDFQRVHVPHRPQLEGEIAVDVGDVVSSVRDLGNGWTLGRNLSRRRGDCGGGGGDAVVGIFPSKCLRCPAPSSAKGRGTDDEPAKDGRRTGRATNGPLFGCEKRRRSGNASYLGKTDRKSFDGEGEMRLRCYCSSGADKTEVAGQLSDDEEGRIGVAEEYLRECSSRCSGCGGGPPPPPPLPSSDDGVLQANQPSQRLVRWVKKPSMAVKPNNLDRNNFSDRNNPEGLLLSSPTTAEDRVLNRTRRDEDVLDLECRLDSSPDRPTVSLPPKSRSTAHRAELSLTMPQDASWSSFSAKETNQKSSSSGSRTFDPRPRDLYSKVERRVKMERTKPGDNNKTADSYTENIPLKETTYDSSNCSCMHPLKEESETWKEGSSSHPPRDQSPYRGSNRCLRLAGSLAVGQAVGTAVFLWMFYRLDHRLVVSASTGGAAAFLLTALLVLSRVCRCVAAVLLPSVCTARGRLAFVVAVSGLLLAGPVADVYGSVREISRSMGCSAEQSYGQMMLFLRPFDTMMAQLNGTVGRLQEAAKNVSDGLTPLDEGLGNVEMDLRNGRLQLYGTRKTCKNLVDSAFSACSSGIHKAQNQCLGVMGALGTVYHHARVVLDRINPDRWSNKQQHNKRQVFADDGSRVMDDLHLAASDRDICDPLDTESVCRSLNDSDALCRPSQWAGEAIQEAINATQSAMSALHGALRFHVSSDPYDRTRNATEILLRVHRRVEDEFAAGAYRFHLAVTVLRYALPLAAFLLLLQSSYLHLSHYVSRDSYDNVYVTDRFRVIDRQRSKVGGSSVLPLRRYERNYLVDTGSVALSPPETGLHASGLCVLGLHVLLTTTCYVFDYVLFWVLALVERHSRAGSDVTGSDSLELVVSGDGIIVELLDVFLKGFHPGRWFSFAGDSQLCLPVPRAPSAATLAALVGLHAVLLATIVCKARVLRLRNHVTGYFYPEREKVRLVYLYGVIRDQRTRLPHLLHQVARSNHQRNQRCSQVSVCHRMLTFRRRRRHGNGVWLPCQRPRCLVCECRSDGAGTFRMCETDRCRGSYCGECFEDLRGVCPLCLRGCCGGGGYDDDNNDDALDDDDDLQSYARMSKVFVY